MARSHIVFLLALGLGAGASVAQTSRPATQTPAAATEARAKALLDELATTGDFMAAVQTADDLFDRVIAYSSQVDSQSFITAAYTRRLVHQLSKGNRDKGLELLAYCRKHEEMSRTLAFLINQQEKPAEVYAALDQLRSERADKPGDYANLTAALCVVHDRPLSRNINENHVEAPPLVDIFDYYTTNDRRLLFGVRNVPAELLVWVVDTTSSIDEMKWALGRYAGDRAIGRHFFDIQYDMAHFRTGQEKAVTRAGFNLQNILKYGGVCADQAYFAVAIGKAIGDPTAYTTARSGQVGHAWVGFLQARGRSAAWNFDEGRYREYQGIKGNVLDPQTRQRVPDSNVSLLAELIGTNTDDRHLAAAMTDAAERMAELVAKPEEFRPEPLVPTPEGKHPPSPRAITLDIQLDFIEAGLRKCPGYARGWQAVAERAEGGALTTAQKRTWCDTLLRLCGKSYPDFTLAIIRPMIASVDEATQQHQLWESMFKLLRNRKDLAAEVRIAQGELWEAQGDSRKAGLCYNEVITRFANDGPFVIDALQRTERMLRESGKASRVAQLYEQTWRKLDKPMKMAGTFREQSNWYQVGTLYVELLRNEGQGQKADAVQAEITREMGA